MGRESARQAAGQSLPTIVGITHDALVCRALVSDELSRPDAFSRTTGELYRRSRGSRDQTVVSTLVGATVSLFGDIRDEYNTHRARSFPGLLNRRDKRAVRVMEAVAALPAKGRANGTRTSPKTWLGKWMMDQSKTSAGSRETNKKKYIKNKKKHLIHSTKLRCVIYGINCI